MTKLYHFISFEINIKPKGFVFLKIFSCSVLLRDNIIDVTNEKQPDVNDNYIQDPREAILKPI